MEGCTGDLPDPSFFFIVLHDAEAFLFRRREEPLRGGAFFALDFGRGLITC